MPDARRAAGPGKPLKERIASVNEREEIEETLAESDEVERAVRAASRAQPSPRVSNEDLRRDARQAGADDAAQNQDGAAGPSH